MKKMFNGKEIARKYGLPYITVMKRIESKYAQERWGVVTFVLPDGTTRRFVPEDKLYLWERNANYIGRPKSKEL